MQEKDLLFIKKLLARSKNVFFAVGGLITAFGFFLLALDLFKLDPSWENFEIAGSHQVAVIFIWILAGVCIVPGIKLIMMAIKMIKIDQHPLIKVLSTQPEKVVWAYETVSKVRGSVKGVNVASGQQSFIHIYLADGTMHPLSIPHGYSKSVFNIISKYAPKAKIGYKKEYQQLVKKHN